jgi:hypothetical protein
MELTDTQEMDAIARPWTDPDGNGRGPYPLENPGVEPITEDLLIDPHPGEPGVGPDGVAAPRENPWGYRRRGSSTAEDRGE